MPSLSCRPWHTLNPNPQRPCHTGHLFDRFAALEQRAGGEVGSPGGPGGARGKGQGAGGGDEEEEEEQQQDLELDEDDGDDMDDDYQTVGACWMSADREA